MAYTTIKKPSEHFETKIWTGNGSSQNITGLNFKPDFVWIKDRDDTSSHAITDAVRGNTKYLMSNDSYQEETITDRVTSFNSDGYSLGSSAGVNQNGAGNVGWNWKANGTGSANTDGTINSTVSADTTSGFSIVSFTGNGSAATVGHGLNSAPEIIFTKNRIDANSWQVGSDYLTSWSYYVRLNTTDAQSSTGGGQVYGTAPTSTVFTVGNDNAVNGSSDGIISYCFHSVKGYSKFGSYTGNGNADGTFVYTGFKPSFVMSKRTDSAGNSWRMFDNKREGYNGSMGIIHANLSDAESIASTIDFLSNGFKIRATTTDQNASGATYIYMAFAEEPLVGDNPATAR